MTPLSLFPLLLLHLLLSSADALGGSTTSATVAVISSPSPTVCAIVADTLPQRILCYVAQSNSTIYVHPRISFDSISGGGGGEFCGVRSGGDILLCWNSSFVAKRLYNNATSALTSLTIGDKQICALTNTQIPICWRDLSNLPPGNKFSSISSGLGFNCGVLVNSSKVQCWGTDSSMANSIQSQFANESMLNIVLGGKFACGLNLTNFLICKDRNGSVKLIFRTDSPMEYLGLALGENHICAIQRSNRSVICSGREGERGYTNRITDGISFESIVAGLNFTCGLITINFTIICWGPGWNYQNLIPLPKILPGPCVNYDCKCGIYPQSQLLCSGNGYICKQCDIQIFPPPPNSSSGSSPPSISPTPSSPSRVLRKGLLAFVIVGSVGCFSGICTLIYCLWTGVCFGKKKVHNSVQPTMAKSNSNGLGLGPGSGPLSRSSTIRRQGSRLMRRQRSGTSAKHADRAVEFSFIDLRNATNDFSLENKIGAGSFGVVYKGKLWDGREVAIKRGETGAKKKKFQEKETAFDSELAFLSRLHHKHLVGLVGYCEENEERLLVYEYMINGALHDHLHDKNNVDKHSSVINYWKMRIKIALDASRGIEYLHNYAVPPIIHRDIKSSNILLDENWIARVSDFGLSLMEPESSRDFRPMKAVGTVGYIDPEYYSLNVLTGKSDVYGFGVVLLEILTGKRAVFKVGEGDDGPVTLVEFAVPVILGGEVAAILDRRVGSPEGGEAEAVELVAYTAVHCVNLEGKDRPNMSDIVANLERALGLCQDSHGSISSGGISIVSE